MLFVLNMWFTRLFRVPASGRLASAVAKHMLFQVAITRPVHDYSTDKDCSTDTDGRRGTRAGTLHATHDLNSMETE